MRQNIITGIDSPGQSLSSVTHPDLDNSNRAARPQEQDERKSRGRRLAKLRQHSNALLRLMAAVMALALLFAVGRVFGR